jgi:hypothetical protein
VGVKSPSTSFELTYVRIVPLFLDVLLLHALHFTWLQLAQWSIWSVIIYHDIEFKDWYGNGPFITKFELTYKFWFFGAALFCQVCRSYKNKIHVILSSLSFHTLVSKKSLAWFGPCTFLYIITTFASCPITHSLVASCTVNMFIFYIVIQFDQRGTRSKRF